MVVIDSDVLLLAFAYPNDERQAVNRKFLESVQTAQPATTIYNVMEVLGQLSFNLSAEQLEGWQNWLINAYNLTIIWDTDFKESIDPETWREIIYERPFQKMQTSRMAFMDALIPFGVHTPPLCGEKFLQGWVFDTPPACGGVIHFIGSRTHSKSKILRDLERQTFQREN